MIETNLHNDQDTFKVASIISDSKWDELKTKALGTVLGIPIMGHYHEPITQDMQYKLTTMLIIMYVLVPMAIVIPSSVIVSANLHALAVLLPVGLTAILVIINDCVLGRAILIHRYAATALLSYFWAVHFWIARQLLAQELITSPLYAAIVSLSFITILTCSCTITFAGVREFSASTFCYQQLSLHSTGYIRLYAAFPLLLTQLAIYYSSEAGISQPALPVILFVVSLLFVVWWFGWISSVYNCLMFFINNMTNCLVFGEQLIHSGHNFRGNTWWTGLLLFLLNTIAIGLNISLVRVMASKGKESQKIIESQHIFLVCMASTTSLIASLSLYIRYRCSTQKRSLIRLNKFDITQTEESQSENSKKKIYNGRFFINHKQVLMLMANLLVPITTSILLVFVFTKYYGGYGNGGTSLSTLFSEKLTTFVVLAVDVGCYILFILIKEITRVRSKLGCSINPCCFHRYSVQIERDLYSKIFFKFTGALAVMVLVLRIQNLNSFSNYIMRVGPLSPTPNPQIQFFVQNILLPVLIYRSYKRSQTFSHSFHITIVISMVLTIIDSTTFYYESILVVLAFPNFPEFPFRLLFLSPFTVPQKLIHKNEWLYRIGYLAVNSVTLILYLVTLGTMELSMIFGLPMYWCVIPSINCQMPKPMINEGEEKETVSKINEFEMSDQALKAQVKINRKTPQYSLYQKIVSEIPFSIFRNKRPGYYLLRISKYILLVEIVADLNGLFEIISLVGLETQEVTTCHAKEGETIDRIVDYNWGNNPDTIQSCACNDTIKTVIHQEHQVQNVKITAENQLQLTGIIESSEFYELYKKCLIRSIIFNYNKFLAKNSNLSLAKDQVKEAEVLLDDLQSRTTKERIDQFFPYEFITQANQRLLYSVKFKELSPARIMIKQKLPPIKKDGQKQTIIDDFAELIGGGTSNTTGNILHNAEEITEKVNIDHIVSEESMIKQKGKPDQATLHSAVIVSAYLSILGKINYLQPERLFKIMKRDASVLNQFEFSGASTIAATSVGCALKIAIGKQLEGEQAISYEDFLAYEKNQFMGTLESPEFSEATAAHREDIWTVAYNQTKKVLSVKRLAKNQTPLYMFSFETQAVQAVWNNLRFELLFATNDNDERYSIQTHQYLLRNLLVEACEQPYGYAGYYSQEFLNL